MRKGIYVLPDLCHLPACCRSARADKDARGAGNSPEVSQLYYQVHLISLHMGPVQSVLYSVAEEEDFDCDLAAKPGAAVLRDPA